MFLDTSGLLCLIHRREAQHEKSRCLITPNEATCFIRTRIALGITGRSRGSLRAVLFPEDYLPSH